MVKVKSFPLRVTDEWLDEVENAKKESESKHDFIIEAVEEKINKRNGEK